MLIPVFAPLAAQFLTQGADAIGASYNWYMYLYMTGIFVSLTNQVSRIDLAPVVLAAPLVHHSASTKLKWYSACTRVGQCTVLVIYSASKLY